MIEAFRPLRFEKNIWFQSHPKFNRWIFMIQSSKSWNSQPVRRLGSRTSFLCCCASNINLIPKNTPPATVNVKDRCRGSKKTCCPSIWGAVMIPGTLQNDGPITSNHPQTSILKKKSFLPLILPHHPGALLWHEKKKQSLRGLLSASQQSSRWVPTTSRLHWLGQSFRNIS